MERREVMEEREVMVYPGEWEMMQRNSRIWIR